MLNIEPVSQKLCAEEGEENCELFLKLTNKMNVEVDVTITLMEENAVVELKDGIWQTYDINEAASTAHFYFLPKHIKHSLSIFYHSFNIDLKITYKLWKSDDTSIDISKWPFPQ